MENMTKNRTVRLFREPAVLSHACVVGKMEGEGPLAGTFDRVEADAYLGQKSWEQAESSLAENAYALALQKAGMDRNAPDMLFAGDLLNQCTGTGYGLRNTEIPHLGLFGACSAMAEGLLLAAICVDGGYARIAGAVASSHFCAAERQFRFPLEYGGQRPPTAQWTVTGAGAVLLGRRRGCAVRITHATPGMIRDAGICDAGNMGAAMAPVNDRLAPYPTTTGQTAFFSTGSIGKGVCLRLAVSPVFKVHQKETGHPSRRRGYFPAAAFFL